VQHFDLATSARTLKTPHRSTTSPRPPRANEGRRCQLRRRLRRAGGPPLGGYLEAGGRDPPTAGHASAASRKTSSSRVDLLKPPGLLDMWASCQPRPEGRVVDLALASLLERRSRQTITKLRTSKKLASSEDYGTSSSGTSSLRFSISHTLSSFALCTAEGSATRA